MSTADFQETPTGQETPQEQVVPSGQEIGEGDFLAIYNLFHDDPDGEYNKKIMEALEQALRDNQIEGYRVTHFTIELKNPPGCHPYVYRCDNGICIGWTCY